MDVYALFEWHVVNALQLCSLGDYGFKPSMES